VFWEPDIDPCFLRTWYKGCSAFVENNVARDPDLFAEFDLYGKPGFPVDGEQKIDLPPSRVANKMQFRLSSLDDFFHLKVNIYTYAIASSMIFQVRFWVRVALQY